jgi:hypothetical protein
MRRILRRADANNKRADSCRGGPRSQRFSLRHAESFGNQQICGRIRSFTQMWVRA